MALAANSRSQLTISVAEWKARVELAAAYRLMDHFGFTDLAHNHICVRVPDEPDALLIKAGGNFFSEVTASSLIKYSFDGSPRDADQPPLTGGGLIIHAGLLAARPDINATIHAHTPATTGVASQKAGLLPINQHAMHFIGNIAYHTFGGFEFDMDQRAPLIRDLGDKNVALLRNHGSLVCAPSLGEAMVRHHQLEMACAGQIAALAGGRDVILIDPGVQAYARSQQSRQGGHSNNGGRNWQGLLRLAQRLFPDHSV
jgi:ribulose-5-phosphate 4-epimerase/fuculose-1-phosphate aldolase